MNVTSSHSSTHSVDTIVARSTPPGSSLQAVVRLSGPRTNELIQSLVTRDLSGWMEQHSFDSIDVTVHTDTPRTATFDGSLFVMQKPRSYTGEDTAELHIPGSTPLVELLIEQCYELGARLAEPGEFTERAFLNGQLDLAQAEAVLSLIEARNEEERQMALGQLEGKLSEKIEDLRERLTHLCAYVESALDFADQDIDVIDRNEIRSYLDPIRTRLENIIRSGREQNPVREDTIGALCGRPNVGKSSLFNELIQEERSIVTEIAGTTRDVIEGTVLLDEQPVRLLDTAGVVKSKGTGPESESLEQQMTERARKATSRADVVLHLEEARTVLDQGVFPDFPFDAPNSGHIQVLSKMDQLTEDEKQVLRTRTRKNDLEEPVVYTSAKEQSGIDQLKQQMLYQLERLLDGGGTFRLNMRHIERMKEAKDHLERARTAVNRGRPFELIAVDLRDALDALGAIVGEVGIEDILGVIFSEFCIGK